MKSRSRQLGPVFIFAGLLGSLMTPARADVWGYVDERGVSHLASEKIDSRYELFFKSADILPSAGKPLAAAVPSLGTLRPVAVPAVPSKLLTFFDISPSYKQVKHHLREAAFVHGIDYELLKAVIATESGFDPQAVSPKGAIGLMQVMPATGERFGVSADRKATVQQKLGDPKTNIRAGSKYLGYLIKLFPGQLDLALAAYNAGEGAVQRAGNKIPRYRETQNYVKTVMQLYAALKPPASLGSLPARALGGTGGPPGGRIRVEIGALSGGRSPMPVRAGTEGQDVAGGAGVPAPPFATNDVVVRNRRSNTAVLPAAERDDPPAERATTRMGAAPGPVAD